MLVLCGRASHTKELTCTPMAATLTAFMTRANVVHSTPSFSSTFSSCNISVYVRIGVVLLWSPLLTLFCVSFHPSIPAVDAGLIGLSLSYTISLAALLQHGVRQAAEVESLVSSECSPFATLQCAKIRCLPFIS